MGGISGILGTVSLLGFVLFLAGAVLAVASASQGRPARSGVLLAVTGLIVGLVFSVISQGLLIVEPTEVAIVTNTLTGNVEEPRRPGTSVVIPVVQQVAERFPLTQIDYTMSSRPQEGARPSDDAVEANTRDGQVVRMDITVIYRLNIEDADDLYRSWRTLQAFQEGFVRPITRSVVRDVISTYQAEELYGERRAELSPDLFDALSPRFTANNVNLESISVREITFSEEFTNAIEQKVVADQNLERARTEAQRAEAEARGRASAAVAAAEGDAQAIQIRALAEAEALRLVSQQIAANPSLIQYLYVQNLSDNINIALVPSNSPFLFDLTNLGTGDPNFVAPPANPETQPSPPSGG